MIVGPATRQIEVPLERVPLCACADTLIPTTDPVDDLEETPWDFVTFEAYPLRSGQASLLDLDGTTELLVSLEESSLDVTLHGPKQRVGLRVLSLAEPRIAQVLLNGNPLVHQDTLTLDVAMEPGWSLQPDGTILAILAG